MYKNVFIFVNCLQNIIYSMFFFIFENNLFKFILRYLNYSIIDYMGFLKIIMESLNVRMEWKINDNM